MPPFWSTAAYRARQFWHELRPRPLTAADWELVHAALTPAEQTLFRRFGPSDQAHSLQVYRALRAAGAVDRPLLAAALLHDVGKTQARLYLWDRVLIVLAGRFMPDAAARWGAGSARGWRRPFAVKADHPAWGAEMAAAAGSDPATVALIRYHQHDPAGLDPALLRPAALEQLRQLRQVDDAH